MQEENPQVGSERYLQSGGKVLFLPNFCTIRPVFAVVVIGELLAIILTLAVVERAQGFFTVLSSISMLVQWIGLSTAGLLCLLRRSLNRIGNGWAGITVFLILLGVTATICLVMLWLDHHLSLLLFTEGQASGLLLRALGISAIVGVLVLHYLYLQHLWRRQEQAESNARLQALYSRIRPHFLFNSMNTIASLTRSDPQLAEEVVENLADLFRVSLGDVGKPSTLGQELELARQYLSIERYRLGERLELEWKLESLPKQAMMPPLILQPLLENAIYHGIEPASKGGRILILGHYRHNRINLIIRNTLPSEDESSHRKGNRMAIENIRARLAGIFDVEASLNESVVDSEYQVRLVVPHPWWT
jgi:two-component system sensor histidine kinase AlgZ